MMYQNFGGYGQVPLNNGYMYGQMPKQTNPLTVEEIQSMKASSGPFSLQMTAEEQIKGICFHLDENMRSVKIDNPDGSSYCPLCQHTWTSKERNSDDVQSIVNEFTSLLQDIKLMYINFPDKAAREFFQILPLCEKVPQLYKIAADNFRSYEGFNNGFMNGNSPFAIYNQISNGGMMGMGMFGTNQQMYGMANPANMYYQPQQPQMAAQQPVMQGANPFVQAPMNMGTTMGVGAPMPGQPYAAPGVAPQYGTYTPNQGVSGYSYTPGQQPVTGVVPNYGQPAQTTQQPTQQATQQPAPVETTGNHTP